MRSWWIVCFLSWYAVAVSCSFHVQNQQGSECVLATPEINFSPLQNTVQLETDLLEEGEEALIGYAMKYVEFQYIGCVNLTTLQREHITQKEIGTSLDPGQCYSACKEYPFFGLKAIKTGEGACRCLPDVSSIYLKERTCVTVCKEGQFLCGSTTSMSIYKKVTVDVQNTWTENNRQCLSSLAIFYYWTSCSINKSAMCFSDTSTRGESDAKWSESIRACFDINMYPMPYIINRSTWRNVWIGVIRTMAITENDAPGNSAGYQMNGYVKKITNTYLMYFTDNSFINVKICETETGSTSISTSKMLPTTATPESVTYKSSTTAKYIETLQTTQDSPQSNESRSTSISTSIMLPTQITTLESVTYMSSSTAKYIETLQTNQDSQQSNVGVLVGVPVAILVIIGIICAVIFLWKSRKQLKDATASSNTQHNGAYMCDYSGTILGNKVSDGREVDPQTTHLQPNVYDSVSDIRANEYHQNANINTYANIENVMHDNQTPGVTEKGKTSEDHGDHTYVVLEKTEKQPHQTNNTSRYTTPEGATNNSANHVNNIAGYSTLNVDKGVYDHIGGNQGRPRDDTSHYDTTSFTKQTDGLYDTTSSSKQTDGMYDTTSSAKQPDGTYDTTSPTKQADGTYDKTSNTKYTDGMYDITAYTK